MRKNNKDSGPFIAAGALSFALGYVGFLSSAVLNTKLTLQDVQDVGKFFGCCLESFCNSTEVLNSHFTCKLNLATIIADSNQTFFCKEAIANVTVVCDQVAKVTGYPWTLGVLAGSGLVLGGLAGYGIVKCASSSSPREARVVAHPTESESLLQAPVPQEQDYKSTTDAEEMSSSGLSN